MIAKFRRERKEIEEQSREVIFIIINLQIIEKGEKNKEKKEEDK